ncbi:hypothetical protein DDZ13_02325 [Coraliomargarita sinensis]|uniref:Uncharacterized protein n=1 Tax=Coraliomargarita sinensis TaxID=2174842 RepID=A0A317ZJG0_9BACT|nr:hypothetical protein [Coraliomargarita sinensis]PXA05726.1 hypothetical protein DDZ13_02325 [Coraliomargarita sinensis]
MNKDWEKFYNNNYAIKIDPDVFRLVVFHRAMDFFVQAQIGIDGEGDQRAWIFIQLPQLAGFFPKEIPPPEIEKLNPLVRDETVQAREAFARKHYMPRVWPLKGEDAVTAFKIECTVQTGRTIWPDLDLNLLQKAYRAKEKREKDMLSRNVENNELPQHTMRYMLCAMWDGYYSHMDSRDQIADSFPKHQLSVTTESVNTAIHQLGLPKGPGPFRVNAKCVS